MSSIKVSVLTPVYNVEQYLPSCLDSLVNQTLKEIEFICINDGSTDKSLEILSEYAAKDRRIKVVNKQNSGYGASMNIGLAQATGEYIGIVEPDDFADLDMFEKMYQIAKENRCDLIRSNRYSLTEDSDNYEELLSGFEYGAVFKPLENQRIFIPAPCIWAHLYRREFLTENEIRFLETPGASFQDTGFVYKSYIAANRMILVKDAFLHYRRDNANSSVNSSSKVFCIVDEFHAIDDYLSNRPDSYNQFKENLEALRYQAYQWNYCRLGWKARHDFLPAIVADLTRAKDNNLLKKECFSESEWGRISRLLDDAESVYRSELPFFSVIIEAYGDDAGIIDTVESLGNQSFRDFEAVVVVEKSENDACSSTDSLSLTDNRISLLALDCYNNQSARNAALEYVSGQHIIFVREGDLIPENALEMLHRTIEENDADCAIGLVEVLSPIGRSKSAALESLSMKKTIDSYDDDLLQSFSIFNMVFNRFLIEELGLKFSYLDPIGEEVFAANYIFNCNKIAGCPHTIISHKTKLTKNACQFGHEIKKQQISEYVNGFSIIMQMAERSFADSIASINSTSEREMLESLRITYINNLHLKLASNLIDLFYRKMWSVSESAFSYLADTIEEQRAYIDEDSWNALLLQNSDLVANRSFVNQSEAALRPLVTIVICKEVAGYIPEALSQILLNGFPRFEVLCPTEIMDNIFGELANVRILEATNSNSELKELALQAANAPAIVFIDDRIYPCQHALKEMWMGCFTSQVSFVAGKIQMIDSDKGSSCVFHSQDELFDKTHTQRASYRDRLNPLDCKLANKMIKTTSLKDSAFSFTETSARDCAQLYTSFAFKKLSESLFYTEMSEEEYLADADKRLCKKMSEIPNPKQGRTWKGKSAYKRIKRLVSRRLRKAKSDIILKIRK